jgi:hypothetical protein
VRHLVSDAPSVLKKDGARTDWRWTCTILLYSFTNSSLGFPVGIDRCFCPFEVYPVKAMAPPATTWSFSDTVRYSVHQLKLKGWCFCFPFVGSWFVDWSWAARKKASDPNLIGEVTAISRRLAVRSTIQAHVKMLDVQLKAFQKSGVSSSVWVSASSFFLGMLLCCWWRSSKQCPTRSPITNTTVCTSIGNHCNFLFFDVVPRGSM